MHQRKGLVEAGTAVPQLLYPEAAAFKWHFPQENAALQDPQKGA